MDYKVADRLSEREVCGSQMWVGGIQTARNLAVGAPASNKRSGSDSDPTRHTLPWFQRHNLCLIRLISKLLLDALNVTGIAALIALQLVHLIERSFEVETPKRHCQDGFNFHDSQFLA